MYRLSHFFLIFFCFFSVNLQAGLDDLFGNNDDPASYLSDAEFLPVEEAFQISGQLINQEAHITVKVTPEHYLYKDRFRFQSLTDGVSLKEPIYPKGEFKFDQFAQKDLEVYPADVVVKIPLSQTKAISELAVTFQGCADAGLCYPPHTINLALTPGNTASAEASTTTNESRSANTSAKQVTAVPPSEKSQLFSLLSSGSWALIIFSFIAGGIALSFTPCVLPMVPILSSLIIGQQKQSTSRSRSLWLSITYVAGMSLIYTLLGVLVGTLGISFNLPAKLQSAWVLVPFAIFFAILSLSMFGLYTLSLPQALQAKVHAMSEQQTAGAFTGVFIMGMLSAVMVSPCVSAPLIAALTYISQTGDPLIGGVALFSLSIGMGIPLILIGAGAGSLLPKAGAWMNAVKNVFGVMLLAVAVWMLERVLPGPVTLVLWAVLLIGSAVYMGALQFERTKGWAALWQSLGIVMMVYGVCLIIGAAQGQQDPLRPLSFASKVNASPANSNQGFTKIYTTQELQQALAKAKNQQKPVMVDFYADWCISCKVIEREVLPADNVKPLLTQFSLIKLDITAFNQDQQQLLKQYSIFGPPALLFFSRTGEELENLRVQGEITANSLENHLRSTLNRS
ncbi:protein-disulfide reductase DsbD [Spartinivicinus poritis]|uniref:Thiol:disulfide interchange protein DsbD n=1 Tax=Spartinivicinus poritis TaxID=2994640 RepID=A0ABT5U4F1_9GAMM|nr:protein-disulfide reductase DsbD [Spartinivicinus sp. A2-2]MDE1461246.1 protein-disulfide reductase DsbD [Spartinivicinus sp. A2-2]